MFHIFPNNVVYGGIAENFSELSQPSDGADNRYRQADRPP